MKKKIFRQTKYLAISLFLFFPVVLLYFSHFYASVKNQDLIPTGFIQYDMAYYMANAREYTDNKGFSVFYPSPFVYHPTKSIYFQPQTIVLNRLQQLFGLGPGMAFCLFGFVSGILCLRVIIQFYQERFGLETVSKKLGLIILCWGGGILTLSGILVNCLIDHNFWDTLHYIFILDPAGGWWFLNLGRNLVFPTEAYYHLLLFIAVLLIHRKQFYYAFLFAFILSFSSPFSGLEFLCILLAWLLIEFLFIRNKSIKGAYVLAGILLIVIHLAYYMIYLPTSPEHKVLLSQWRLAWNLDAIEFVPAYILVGGIFLYTVRNTTLFIAFFKDPFNRFCFIWFLVAFALANHEFAFTPHQPLHFTRGYIWTPLCLLGISTLIYWLDSIFLFFRSAFIRYTLVISICLVLLFDNISWFLLQSYFTIKRHTIPLNGPALYLNTEIIDVFNFLNKNEYDGYYIVSEDDDVGYLATVYTPLRSWRSHIHNTPESEKRANEIRNYFNNCVMTKQWKKDKVLYIVKKNNGIKRLCLSELKLLHENMNYQILQNY